MMGRKVNTERFVRGARRRHMQLGACPFCGGDVRQVRDIYGTYRQCLQCSREIHPDAVPAIPAMIANTTSLPQTDELLVA